MSQPLQQEHLESPADSLPETKQRDETRKILEECTDCGSCVKACNFLRHYCDSPRELARRFARNPLENIEIPYSCTLCGLCQRICKLDLYPGGMCHETRVKIFQPLQDKKPPDDFIYDFVTPRLKGIRNHQIFSSSPIFSLNHGPEAGQGALPKRLFFPGCSLPAYSPSLVYKSYQYLRQKMPGLGVVLNCCGKPSKDMGDMERFDTMFNNTMTEFNRNGVEEVVLACINCHKTFRENSKIRLRTIYEVMAEEGLPEAATPGSGEITLHDSCPARHQSDIRQAIRAILSQLGYRVHNFRFNREMTQCCGAGGCAATGNTTLAGRHTRDRAAQARGTVVTYCAHCRERFSSQVPALHILDLVFGASYKKPLTEAHDGWQNWFDRWYLKRKLNRRITP